MTGYEQKQHKVFYGWWIVGAVFLIVAYSSGIIIYGFTAIFEPIANEFGWSYAQVSFAASIRGMESSLLAPVAGLLFDRLGPRKLIFAGAIIIGLGLFLLGHINSLATFYGVFILIAIGLSIGGGAVIPMATVGNWFRRNVALATGITISGHAAGGLLVPLVTRFIDTFEWREAMAIFGLGTLVIVLPLSLLVRHKPEQYGYLPDGAMANELDIGEGLTSAQTDEQTTEEDIGIRQVLKGRAFWQIALGITCHMVVVQSVLTHVMPYLSSIGIARSISSLVASAIVVTSILGRLSFGWFGDRFDRRRLTAAGLTLISLGLLLFSYIAPVGTWLLLPFIIVFGIGYGGPVTMVPALTRGYFGATRLGTVIGLTVGIAGLGSIVGPPLTGWVFDSFGSYQGAWFGLAGAAIVGMVSLLTAPLSINAIQTVGKSENAADTK